MASEFDLIDSSNLLMESCNADDCDKPATYWEAWQGTSSIRLFGYCCVAHLDSNTDMRTLATFETLDEVKGWLVDQTL